MSGVGWDGRDRREKLRDETADTTCSTEQRLKKASLSEPSSHPSGTIEQAVWTRRSQLQATMHQYLLRFVKSCARCTLSAPTSCSSVR